MAFNINDFQAQIHAPKFNGLSMGNKFLVEITPPTKIFGGTSAAPTMKELSFFCDTTNLPGKTINTIDYKPEAYGEIVKMPMSRSNDSLTVSFFCDSNYSIMEFFHEWLSYIVQDEGRTYSNRGFREIGYKEDYATTLTLKCYDVYGNPSDTPTTNDQVDKISYVLKDAYPTQIGAVQMGWEMNDQVLKIPVEFTYSSMATYKYGGGLGGSAPTSSVGLFTRIAQLGSIAGVINSIKRPRSLQDLVNLGTTIRTTTRTLF
jgi:hypothetical protein